jgi:hypothetical protein
MFVFVMMDDWGYSRIEAYAGGLDVGDCDLDPEGYKMISSGLGKIEILSEMINSSGDGFK